MQNKACLIKKYAQLLRVKHYLKNIVIFLPIVFGGELFNFEKFKIVILAFIPFCLCTSCVYIINDIKDKDKDRKHPTKCKRPIASGDVPVRKALAFLTCVFVLMAIISAVSICNGIYSYVAIIWLGAYVAINLLYSFGLKKVPILDVSLLAAGFLIRLYYGSCVSQIEVSPWLYLTLLGGSFYLGMGKRRNELKDLLGSETRDVLKKYNYSFLDKNMHISVAFTEICYALWSAQSRHSALIWTVPIIMIIFMKYSLDIESDNSEGNPLDVLLADKMLLVMIILYIVITMICIYLI